MTDLQPIVNPKPGDTVAFQGRGGSWGIIEAANNYGGFYVRWYYGKDVAGEDICERSSVKPHDLVAIPSEVFARYRACAAWTPEQAAIAREVFP